MIETNKELQEIEKLYQNIRLICEDSLYDTKSYNHKSTKKIVNLSLFLVNQAEMQIKNNNNTSNLGINKIKTILSSIHKILLKLDFFSNKEKEIKDIIESNSINMEDVYLSI